MPRDFEKLTIDEIVTLKDMTYQERAVTVLKRFLDDFTIDELKDCVSKAYNNKKFTSPDIVPVKRLTTALVYWNSGTVNMCFKDMALQILPHFLVKAMEKTGEQSEIVLVATSVIQEKPLLKGLLMLRY